MRAWEVVSGNASLRVVTENLEYVSNYLNRYPNLTQSVKSNFDALLPTRQQSFINGIRNAALDPLGISNARRALPNEISDAVNRIADHRATNTWAGNWGFLEGQTTPFVNLLNDDGATKFWRSVSLSDAENEIHIFTAIDAPGSNGSEWLRITDSEYRMLNKFASDFGAAQGGRYEGITGTLKIVSENPYCRSCQGVIQQFNNMFPNIDLILVDGVR